MIWSALCIEDLDYIGLRFVLLEKNSLCQMPLEFLYVRNQMMSVPGQKKNA